MDLIILKAHWKKHKIKLKMYAADFSIINTPELPKPMRKDEVVKAKIMCNGRLPKEKIAVARERCISVMNCDKAIGSEVRVKILRNKHNVYNGICV